MANPTDRREHSKVDELRILCPKDGITMEKVRVGELVIDHCARCGGMWFDPYELAAALNHEKAAQKIDTGGLPKLYTHRVYNPTNMECPRDHTSLISVPDARQPHVMIDICRTCGGVLLDAGELKDLDEFTISERLRAFFS